ncbi:MAG: DUF4129 domain-containing protein [Anaerolineaceae bacterium]|nr:DUF4129 domain-containing protein [Anaerolineaceae bacterium]
MFVTRDTTWSGSPIVWRTPGQSLLRDSYCGDDPMTRYPMIFLGLSLVLVAAFGVPAQATEPDRVRRDIADRAEDFKRITIDPQAQVSREVRRQLVVALRRTQRELGEVALPMPGGADPQVLSTRVFGRLVPRVGSAATSRDLLKVRDQSLAILAEMRRSLDGFEQSAARFRLRRLKLEQARMEMTKILQADEFQVRRDRVNELFELIQSSLQKFYRWLGVSGNRVQSLSQRLLRTVLAVSLGLIGLIVGRVLWRHFRNRQRKQPARSRRLEPAVRLSSPDTHARAARRALDLGNFRRAIHHGYLMVLSALERRHLVMVDRTRTNWEYHGQLLEQQAVESARRLAEMNRFYDRKWYGHEPLNEAEARRFDSLARRLVEEVRNEAS